MIAMERNEDNLANAASSDDEGPLDEGEDKLRSIHFLKQKESDGEDGEGKKVDVKRYDEMGSFLSRSERTLSLPDLPPTEEELAARRVRVKDDVNEVHKDVEPMSAEEKRAYYMTDADFRRVDIDVELTTMRWEKAKKTKGKFDEEENPLRGLEEMLDTHNRRATLRKKHRAAVLEEMVRQKTSGKKELDWEKIRAAAEPFSKETAEIAYHIALEDAGKPVPKKAKTSDGKKKGGGGLFGLFKGKSKK